MQSLTDRMAAVLRDVLALHPSYEIISAVLAEYEAERNPLPPARITAGSHVRCTRASKKTGDYQAGDEAKVQGLTADGRAVVTWLTDLSGNTGIPRSHLLRLADCELVFNFPATNTGD